MKKFVILILFIMCFQNCTKQYTINLSPKTQDSAKEALLLEVAYMYKSEKLLDVFFTKWIDANISNHTILENKSPVKDIYEIFSIFFKPDTSSISSFINNDSLFVDAKIDRNKIINFTINTSPFYRDAEFLVIQSKIHYSIVTNFDSTNNSSLFKHKDVEIVKNDSIINFQPKVNYFNKKIIYDNVRFTKALNAFLLGERVNQYSKNNNVDIDSLSVVMHSKRSFLSKKIQTATHHWDIGWYYRTMPIISYIYFNEEIDKAKIFFRDSWSTGGFAIFKKSKDIWEQESYQVTWIE